MNTLFLAPEAWWLILVIVPCLGLLCWRLRRIWYCAAYFPLRHFSWRKSIAKAVLFGGAMLSILLIFLRPGYASPDQEVTSYGRDIYIALDVSRSMLVEDVAPNRLTVAKQKINALVEALRGERLSLVLFSGAAFVQCPLTVDRGAFSLLLKSVDVETFSSGTTAIGQAIRVVMERIKAQNDGTRYTRVLVLFTDGEDFSSDSTAINTQAKELGLIIIAVGIGTREGGPIPVINDRGQRTDYQRDTAGAVVISRLDEQKLQAITSKTGGFYQLSTADSSDITTICRVVERLERTWSAQKKATITHEQYPWLAGLSFLLLLLEWML